MGQLKKGDPAPGFSGKDQDGNVHSLDDYKGKRLIVYFYPKDSTPGCTAEACNLRDNYDDLKAKGFAVLGISADSESSHKKFSDKHDLPFPLIADEDKSIIKKYGAWGEKKMYGKSYEGILRKTIIINEEGHIENIIEKVKTKDHARQIYQQMNIE